MDQDHAFDYLLAFLRHTVPHHANYWDLSSHPWIDATLLEKNPKAHWNWFDLYQNPCIPAPVIRKICPRHVYDFLQEKKKRPRKPVCSVDDKNVATVSLHPDLSFDLVIDHQDLQWQWDFLSRHPRLQITFVLALPQKPWCWYGISQNPWCINDEVIAKYPYLPWDGKGLSENPNITLKTVLQYYPANFWDWPVLCKTKRIEVDLSFWPALPWDWEALSQNPFLTMQMIKTFSDKPWDWGLILQNRTLSWDPFSDFAFFLSKLGHSKIHILLSHPCITFSFLQTLGPIDLHYFIPFTDFPTFLEMVVERCTEQKNIYLPRHPTPSFDLVEANPDWTWDWDGFLKRPDLRFRFVQKFFSKFSTNALRSLKKNPFCLEKKEIQKQMALQTFWRGTREELMEKVWHPRRLAYLLALGYSIDDWCGPL